MKTYQLVVIPVVIFFAVVGVVIFTSNVGEEEIGKENEPVYFEGFPRVNQNDRWCSTSWIIHHDVSINTKQITEKIRQKIAEFGKEYDISERSITIKLVDENQSRIRVQGVWDGFESNEPSLTSFISTRGFDAIDEPRVVCA